MHPVISQYSLRFDEPRTVNHRQHFKLAAKGRKDCRELSCACGLRLTCNCNEIPCGFLRLNKSSCLIAREMFRSRPARRSGVIRNAIRWASVSAPTLIVDVEIDDHLLQNDRLTPIVDVPRCSLLRTRDQSRSLRCGWEIDDHLFHLS
jgi:hypothetical protein